MSNLTTSVSQNVYPFKANRHTLTLDIILFHMVNFRTVKGLPVNQDCTPILQTAALRVIDRMFKAGELYVESFMPRCNEFQVKFCQEIVEYSQGLWHALSRHDLQERMEAHQLVRS